MVLLYGSTLEVDLRTDVLLTHILSQGLDFSTGTFKNRSELIQLNNSLNCFQFFSAII